MFIKTFLANHVSKKGSKNKKTPFFGLNKQNGV